MWFSMFSLDNHTDLCDETRKNNETADKNTIDFYVGLDLWNNWI